MSQEELGEKTNADKGTVSRWENEKRQFDTATIHTLCDLFNCTSDYLLGRSSFRHPIVTDDEARLLAAYEAASLRDRMLVDQILSATMPEAFFGNGSQDNLIRLYPWSY